MKSFLIILSVLLIVFNAKGQVVTVKDIDTEELLEMVNIVSEKPREFAVTNFNGQAKLDKFKGSERIDFRLVGYEILSVSYQQILDSNKTIHLNRSNISLNQVVISANKHTQLSSETPVKISIISAKQAELHNPQTAADLLGAFGDVYIQKSQQGGGSPMIRGFSTNRLLYSVDGVRMNNAIFRSGNLQNVISLDPFTIENTEVLYGPGSVIYGSDAIGGVMNFQTINPTFSLSDTMLISGRAVMRYASANNENTAHFEVKLGFKKWAFVSSFTHTDYGDLRMGENGPDDYKRHFYVNRINDSDYVIKNDDPYLQTPTAYSQRNFMQKISFKPNQNLLFNYGFHYSKTSDYDRYDRLIRTKNGLPRSAEWYYGPQIWMMNNFSLRLLKSTKIYDNAEIRLAHQFFEESRNDRDFNKDLRYRKTEIVNAYSLNLDFEKRIKSKGKLYYGLEYIQNVVNSDANVFNIISETQNPTASRYPDAHWHSIAAYFNYAVKLNEKLNFQIGGRYNHFILNADFSGNKDYFPLPELRANFDDGALTGNAGFVYNINSKTAFSLNLSTAFRSPNVDDVGKVFDSEPGAVVVPNTKLNAEYAYNADIGIARIISNNFKIDASAYYTYLNNALVRRDFILNGKDSIIYDGEMSKVQAIQNAAMAYVYGVQIGLELKFPFGFSFSSKLNYQKGIEEMDDGSQSPSRHAAPMFGISALKYNYKKISLHLYSVYNGEISYENMNIGEISKDYLYAKDRNGNPYSPAWYTINIKASYKVNPSFSVNIGLENITDQLYRPYSSGISASGRNLVISLNGRF